MIMDTQRLYVNSRIMKVIGCVCLGLIAQMTYAQTGVATALVAGKEAKDVVQEAQDASVNVLQDARNEGSALAVKAANEAQVAANNVLLSFGGDINKKFEDLSAAEQTALAGLAQLTNQVKQIQGQAWQFKDSLTVDVRDIFGNLLFSHLDYFVERVDGITLLKREDSYRISILGIGFGPDSEKRHGKIESVTLNGHAIPFTTETNHADVTTMVFSAHDLNPYFIKEKAPTRAKLVVNTVVSTKGMLWGWNDKSFTLPLTIALFPDFAGHIVVHYTASKKDWVPAPEGTKVFSTGTPNYDGAGSHHKWVPEPAITLPDDERFVTPFIVEANGPMQVFSDTSARPTIADGGRTLNFGFWAWGPPFTITYGAHVEKLVDKDVNGTVETDLSFSQSATVQVPANTTFWKISGETSSKQVIDLVSGGSSPYLVLINVSQTADHKLITLSSPRPDDM